MWTATFSLAPVAVAAVWLLTVAIPVVDSVIVDSGTVLVVASESEESDGAGVRVLLEQLGRHNFLVGVANVGARHENDTQCGKELEMMLAAVARKEWWSLKVLDSFGAAPKSFGWGNHFWFASQALCDDLNTPYRITFSERRERSYSFNVSAPFLMQFSMVYFKFQTPHFIDLELPFENFLHIGFCMPHSCSLDNILRYSEDYFQSNIFETQRNFELHLQAVDAKAPTFNWNFFKQTGSILYISTCLLALLLVIVAELIYKSKTNLKIQQTLHIKTQQQPSPSPPTTTTVPETTTETHSEKSVTLDELLLNFRLSENCKRALKLDNSNNFLSVIAGLRSIICLWVTMFHVYYYSLFAMTNTPIIFAKLENFALQPVMQACFYVDVFFVMSAFLLVYNFLSNETQVKLIQRNNFVQNGKLFLKAILYRYMRLTPVLVITMLLSDMFFDLLNMYSPFRLDVHSGIYCKNNWWYNLLYIQNFLDMKDICCSWTWYLGCEMQFFVLFTALLFVYAKSANAGKIVFATLALGFAVGGFWCNYRNGITFQIDVIHSTLNELYVKPWVRINPYVGGAALGWLLHRQRTNGGRLQLDAVWRAVFWLFCSVFYVVTNFMSYWRSTPSWLVAAIMSFGKLLFGICVGGVIVMCAWGHGGHLNTLLSARVFLFLNKFCFSVYMLAPVIVMAVFGLRNEATNFTEVGSGTDFLAIILLAIAAAFLLVVLVELPMQRISNALLRTGKRERRNESAVKCAA